MAFALNVGQPLGIKAGTASVINYCVSGLLTAGAGQTPMIAVNGQLGVTTVVAVVTPSSGQQLTVTEVELFNTSGSQVTVGIYKNGTAATNQTFNFVIPPNGSARYGGGIWQVYDTSGTPLIGGVSTLTTPDSTLTSSGSTGAIVLTRPAISGDVTINTGSNTALVGKVNGVAVPSSPSAGQAIVATSGSAASWQTVTTTIFGRSGAVTATSGDYTASQVTGAADKGSGSTQTFTGQVTAPEIGATLSGTQGRYIGFLNAAPTGGGTTYQHGDFGAGDNGVWVCTTAGAPGIWSNVPVINPPETIVNESTTTHSFQITDAQCEIMGSNGSAQNFTIPQNSSIAYPVGTVINFTQVGTGKLSLVQAGTVTIHSPGGLLGCRVQYSSITIVKTATDTWQLTGDLG